MSDAGAVADKGARFSGSRLLRSWVALDKNGGDVESVGRLDTRDRIADHKAVSRVRVRKITEGLVKQPRLRLSAIALVLIVGAIVESLDAGPVFRQMLLEPPVETINIRTRAEPQRHTTLVAQDARNDS